MRITWAWPVSTTVEGGRSSLILPFCLLSALALVLGCSSYNTRHGAAINPDSTHDGSTTAINDWLCVPGVRCGPITALTTEAELMMIFGEENVSTVWTWVAEGTHQAWLSDVIESTGGCFEVLWFGDDSPQRISYVSFHSPRSRWHTAQGIRVGTTLAELNEVNGTPFVFYGFNWDYGGLVVDWCGGELEELQITLFYCGSADPGEYLTSDLIRSDDPGLQALGISVEIMDFNFQITSE